MTKKLQISCRFSGSILKTYYGYYFINLVQISSNFHLIISQCAAVTVGGAL